MHFTKSIGPWVAGIDIVERREGFGWHALKRGVDHLTEAALRNATDIFIDRHDALEVDGIRNIIAHDLELGMVDHDATRALLRLAIKNHLMPRREHLVHEGHVKPAAGHAGKPTTSEVFDNYFVEAFSTKSLPLSIDDGATETDCRTASGRRESIKATAILVALRKPIEEIICARETSREEGFLLTPFQKRKFVEGCHSVSSDARTCWMLI